MKKFSAFMLFGLFLSFISFHSVLAFAAEKDYPNRPIEIMVGFAPGGATDLASRAVASTINEYLGQPAVVVNKAGGGGIIAGEYVARTAKPDGYTVWHAGITIAAPELYAKFRPASFTSKDVDPVCSFAAMIGCFTVRADAPWNSISDLVEYVRKNPGLKFSGPGVTTGFQILGQALGVVTKTRFVSVPLKGDGESVSMLLGKHVDMSVMSLASAKPQIEAKKFKVLGYAPPSGCPIFRMFPPCKNRDLMSALDISQSGPLFPKEPPNRSFRNYRRLIKKPVRTRISSVRWTRLGLPVVYEDTDKIQQIVCKRSGGFS